MHAALAKARRYGVDRKSEVGGRKGLEVLHRESALHVRPVERDEDDDDSRVDGLAQEVRISAEPEPEPELGARQR